MAATLAQQDELTSVHASCRSRVGAAAVWGACILVKLLLGMMDLLARVVWVLLC
jgi:hypothetical protein